MTTGKESDYRDALDDASISASRLNSMRSEGQRWALMTDILFAVALSTAGTGTYLLMVEPEK
jgi:hypothetical protein